MNADELALLSGNEAAQAAVVDQNYATMAVGVFVFGISWLTWIALKLGMGVRVSSSVEEVGQDAMELGIEAYPEFVLMPDPDDVDGLRNSSGEA